MGCWSGYLSGERCRLAYGPADATVSCFSKIQISFTFLVPAHPGCAGQRVVKQVCVCYMLLWWNLLYTEICMTVCILHYNLISCHKIDSDIAVNDECML